MGITSYKDVLIRQKGIELAVDVYTLRKEFPETEKYGLSSQIQRSASSVPANIAEGYGHQSTKSYSQFIKISKGSLFELETFLILAERLSYVTKTDLYNKIKNQISEEGKM